VRADQKTRCASHRCKHGVRPAGNGVPR